MASTNPNDPSTYSYGYNTNANVNVNANVGINAGNEPLVNNQPPVGTSGAGYNYSNYQPVNVDPSQIPYQNQLNQQPVPQQVPVPQQPGMTSIPPQQPPIPHQQVGMGPVPVPQPQPMQANINMNVGGGVTQLPPQPYSPPRVNPPPQPQMTTTTVTVQPQYYPQPVIQPAVIVGVSNEPTVCGNPIPILDPGTACVVLIINILFPGIGTMIVGCAGRNANCYAWFCIGILQIFLLFCFIGWIWAIITGIQVMARANQPRTVTLL